MGWCLSFGRKVLTGENELCTCKYIYSSEHRWRKMAEDCRNASVGKAMQGVLCRQVSSGGSHRAAHKL